MKNSELPELTVQGRVLGDGQVVCRISANCARCARGEGCAQAAWLWWRARRVSIALPTAGMARGQRVNLSLPPGGLLHAAWLAYGMPLLGLVLGAMAGLPGGSEPLAVAGGLFGVVTGVALGRRLARRNAAELQPRLCSAANEAADDLLAR